MRENAACSPAGTARRDRTLAPCGTAHAGGRPSTSIVGALAKLGAGAVTGSVSLISSASISLGDLIVSIPNLFVVRYGACPPDDPHNHGHAAIEALGPPLPSSVHHPHAATVSLETHAGSLPLP